MLRRRIIVNLFFILIPFCYSTQATPISTPDQSNPATEEGVIVAFGDSLTSGLGVPADQAYPALLKEKLHEEGYRYRVVNAGVSGDTTAGGLRRMDWILKRIRPDIVILELGANDGLRGLDLGQMKKNLATIIERFQENDVTVILVGMKIPPNYGQDYTGQFEKTFQNLADRYNLAFIPFFLEGVATKPLLNQADGLHPTAKGYRIVVDHVWAVLEQLIKSRQRP